MKIPLGVTFPIVLSLSAKSSKCVNHFTFTDCVIMKDALSAKSSFTRIKPRRAMTWNPAASIFASVTPVAKRFSSRRGREEQRWQCLDGEYSAISACRGGGHRSITDIDRTLTVALLLVVLRKIAHTHKMWAMESYSLAIVELSLSIPCWTSSSVIASTSRII